MLTPDQSRRVAAALDVADRNAAAAEAARPGIIAGFMALMLDAEPAVKGAVASVEASQRLAAELRAKADRWREGFALVEDVEVADFERSAGAVAAPEAAKVTELLSPGAAIRETAAGFVSPSTWPGWLKTALGLAVALVVVVVVAPWVIGGVVRRGRP